MSGGKKIPDEWIEEEYPASVITKHFVRAGDVGAKLYEFSVEGFAEQRRDLELAEIRRAEADTL